MESVFDFFFPPEALIFLGLVLFSFILIGALATRAAAKACTGENAKKAAILTAKVIGGTVLKVAVKDYKAHHKN